MKDAIQQQQAATAIGTLIAELARINKGLPASTLALIEQAKPVDLDLGALQKIIDERLEAVHAESASALANPLANIDIGEGSASSKPTYGRSPLWSHEADKLCFSYLVSRAELESTLPSSIEAFLSDMKDTLAASRTPSGSSMLSILMHHIRSRFWCLSPDDSPAFLDVSFSEFARIEAAFASARGGATTPDRPFRYLIGDISGIQNYIFGIPRKGGFAKRLRGRSLYIQLVTEDIKRYCLNQLGLQDIACLVTAGGKFLILVPNIAPSETTAEKLTSLRLNVEKKMWERFLGEVVFTLADTGPLTNTEARNIGEYLNNNIETLVNAKNQPMGSILQLAATDGGGWNTDVFLRTDIFTTKTNNKECLYCGKYASDDPSSARIKEIVVDPTADATEDGASRICLNCAQDWLLGKHLNDTRAFVWGNYISEKFNGRVIRLPFHDVYMSEATATGTVKNLPAEFKPSHGIVINGDAGTIKSLPSGTTFEAAAFATHIPQTDNKEAKDFEAIGGDSGFNKLAMLKGDVDNLGKIFALGIAREADHNANSARVATVSLLISLFFEGYLNEVISGTAQFNDCYIVYSGGDDFVIIGRWNVIIQLAAKLENDFQDFVSNNPNLHFSAAVTLFQAHLPIFSVIHQAEQELHEAKTVDEKKHRTRLLGDIIPGSALPNLHSDVQQLYATYVQSGTVSSGSLRFLLDTARFKADELTFKANSTNDSSNEIIINLWRPRLTYHLSRLYAGPPGSPKQQFKSFSRCLLLDEKPSAENPLALKDMTGLSVHPSVALAYLSYLRRDAHAE
jgi:CRISPR-associated protein Cas10/Csm1 subtype III-A